MKRMLQALASVYMLVAAYCGTLHAQVTYVDKNALGSNNGTSWVNAYTNLQTALDNTTSGQIWVADATYKPSGSSFAIKSAVQLYGGFVGNETQLSQRNPVANPAILDGDIAGNDPPAVFDSLANLDNALHVIYVDSLLTGTVVIDGFAIKGGITDDDNTQPLYFWKGGGIHAQSTVAVRNCAFTRNWARSGGSIYIGTNAEGSEVRGCSFTFNGTSSQSAGIYGEATSDLTIADCNFSSNETIRGMIYPFRCTDVLIDSCHFGDNTNAGGFAAAIFNWNCVDITISNSEFIGNSSANGGALNLNGTELVGISPDNLVFENCLFQDNIATDFGGGGIYNSSCNYTMRNCTFTGGQAVNGCHIFNTAPASEVVIEDCTFEFANSSGWGGSMTCYGEGSNYQINGCTFKSNSTTNLGGAVNNGFAANVTYQDCIFEENVSTTSSGGALGLQNDSTTIAVINCEFTSNTAAGNGGAIFSGASTSSSIVAVDKSTFLVNSAGVGGAIFQSENGDDDISTLTISNSVFGFNSASTQGGAISMGDTEATITSCLFFQNTAADTGTGGAISNNASDSNTVVVNIINSTFAQNSGTLAAGIANWTGTVDASSQMNLLNNIFWQEGAINYAVEDGSPEVISLGGNLSDDDSFEDYFDHPKDIQGEEPTFVDPDDYDYHLTSNSIGVNDGVSAGAPTTDLEGKPRKEEVDMGAYENQTPTGVGEKLLPNIGMLALSPNPALHSTTKLQLENGWRGEVLLRVIDVTGKLVATQSAMKVGEQLIVDLVLPIPAGIYSVQASNGEEMVVERLIRL